MPRNDQVTGQWHLLRELESGKGLTLRELRQPSQCGSARVPAGERQKGSAKNIFSFGLVDQAFRKLRRRDPATLQPDELASNPELRGVVETLCNSLKEAGGQKGQ